LTVLISEIIASLRADASKHITKAELLASGERLCRYKHNGSQVWPRYECFCDCGRAIKKVYHPKDIILAIEAFCEECLKPQEQREAEKNARDEKQRKDELELLAELKRKYEDIN
jgi:hypothetical protein